MTGKKRKMINASDVKFTKFHEVGTILQTEEDFLDCEMQTTAIDMDADIYVKAAMGWIMKSCTGEIQRFSSYEMSKISKDFFIKIHKLPLPN